MPNINSPSVFSSKKAVSASRVFDELDARDGKKDGVINASIWNNFANSIGGKPVQICISKNAAMKSINFYIRKGKKDNIFNYMNSSASQCSKTEINSNSASIVNSTNVANEALTLGGDFNLFERKTESKEKDTSFLVDDSLAKKPLTLNNETSFSAYTNYENNKNTCTKTRLLDEAKKHIGLIEITEEEYKSLKNDDKALSRTQMAMIPKDKGQVSDSWCAHTVSTISRKAGFDIGGHKIRVSEFIDWAKDTNTYRSIKTKRMDKENITQETESRSRQINIQASQMSEGDFIVWKSQYTTKPENHNRYVNKCASHIGIIESVNRTQSGEVTITVIEGNANEFKRSSNGSLSIVTSNNSQEGYNGDQSKGEFQEVNRRDGLIRKTYTINELAAMGYSGYIDNSGRLNRASAIAQR